MHKELVVALEPAFHHHLPPAHEGHLDDPCTEPVDGRQLHARSVVGGDDRGADACLTCRPCDRLAHVAGTRRDNARRERFRWGLPDGIHRSANLESADRLQALELEPDLARRVRQLGTDERGA